MITCMIFARRSRSVWTRRSRGGRNGRPGAFPRLFSLYSNPQRFCCLSCCLSCLLCFLFREEERSCTTIEATATYARLLALLSVISRIQSRAVRRSAQPVREILGFDDQGGLWRKSAGVDHVCHGHDFHRSQTCVHENAGTNDRLRWTPEHRNWFHASRIEDGNSGSFSSRGYARERFFDKLERARGRGRISGIGSVADSG